MMFAAFYALVPLLSSFRVPLLTSALISVYLLSQVAASRFTLSEIPVPRQAENECICSIVIPDSFPSQMIDFAEDALRNLTQLVQEEMEKIIPIIQNITSYNDAVNNMTNAILDIETNGIKDEADYLKTTNEIGKLANASDFLVTLLNETDDVIENILNQVNNVSSVVWQLESFDKNGVLVTHREMAALRKQLAECEDAITNLNFGVPAVGRLTHEYGKCDQKEMVNISKPFIVKLNWRGFSYKYGAWGKDFAINNKNPDMYWVAPLNTDERLMETYRLYNTYKDLLLYKNQIEKSLSQFVGFSWNYMNCGQGSGGILYNGSFYYNCHNSRNLCKLDIVTNNFKRKTMEGAAFNNWFSYMGVRWQDFDFAGDEKGLWVVYSTENSKGKITIAQLDPENLDTIKKWETALYKTNITNTFMICGVLYALKRQTAHKETIFYTYDTNTGKEGTLNIALEKLSDTPQSVSYNPNDHKIYMYNDGYLVTYDVIFKPRPMRARRSVATVNGQNSLMTVHKGWQQFAVI
ncbi:olfactomedin [Pogona vitticeps]